MRQQQALQRGTNAQVEDEHGTVIPRGEAVKPAAGGGHVDNRRGGDARLFGGSRILAIDPGTRLSTTLYGAAPGQSFYTDTMGGQQSLPNGDLLITESDKGHAFEVDPGGNVVWSYVNRWADGSVGKISEAMRYPVDYLSHASKEPCHGS